MTKLARRVTLLLIFASLLPPAATDARRPGEPVIRGGSLTKGPVLAGRRAAWSQDNGEDTEIVRTGARGIRAHTVYREQAIFLQDLAASSSRLAFASVFTGGAPQGPLSVGVLAGPLSGPFAARGGSCPGPRVALAGGRLLSLDKPSRCGGSGPDVAVVEDATGAVQRVPLGVRAADPVAIAGRLFAFVDATNRAVTVFDLSERRVVLRVPTSVDPAPGLDLQPDGKLGSPVASGAAASRSIGTRPPSPRPTRSRPREPPPPCASRETGSLSCAAVASSSSCTPGSRVGATVWPASGAGAGGRRHWSAASTSTACGWRGGCAGAGAPTTRRRSAWPGPGADSCSRRPRRDQVGTSVALTLRRMGSRWLG